MGQDGIRKTHPKYCADRGMVTLTASNDVRELPRLLRGLDEFREQSGLQGDAAARLNLVVEELFVNFATHACVGEGVEPQFEAAVERDGDRVACVVRDNGAPFDPRVVGGAPVDGAIDQRPVGGLGLRLIRRLATQLNYETADGVNTTTIVLQD